MFTLREGAISEISLQHVLEDGLALAENRLDEPEARESAIAGVKLLFGQATRGYQIVNKKALFIKANEKTAFDTFALMFKYLDRTYREDLSAQLSKTTEVFNELSTGQDVPADGLDESAKFLRNFLRALEIQQSLAPPLTQAVYA